MALQVALCPFLFPAVCTVWVSLMAHSSCSLAIPWSPVPPSNGHLGREAGLHSALTPLARPQVVCQEATNGLYSFHEASSP